MPFMGYLMKLVVLLGVVSRVTPAPLSPSSQEPVVDLEYSQYHGIGLESGVNQYLGMRYAAPPLGDLRFRAPANPLKISVPPVCLAMDTKLPSNTHSEDCLFVNVWGPTDATSKSKLPVWVYISGGGYTENANANYNGSTVVAQSGQNIVMVNFGYRVGSYGFLAGEKVRANGDLNAGLLDQRMALEWVQQHIEQFGGDPGHVVIHGASAGAGSVALHLTAYGGRDDRLFVGAIGESVFFPAQPQVSELEWQFSKYVKDTGCAASSDELKCLRSKDLTILQKANVAAPFPGRTAAPLFYWTPTIDGSFIQDYPYRLIEQGKFVKVPIMFGDDTNEGTKFATDASTPAAVASFLQDNYPHLTSADTDEINAQYPLMAPLPKHAKYFPSAAAAYGETTFTCVGNYISQTFAKMNNPGKVWNYRTNILQPDEIAAGLGVPHVSETIAIFGPGNAHDSVDSSYRNTNADIIPVVMDYFISFIRELSPNSHKLASAPQWDSFGDGNDGGRRLKLQTNATVMETIPQDQVKRCEFWRGLALTMEQ
ncbi:Lipase [Lachnellula occidentalis]|uniref:Carboxylic ester hydrolase n=1 Tax=Lachnellula occidentalis TaxID=215460 RepID=A0A8H8RC28_9HELO|nr:Lipase [Lachnellula occidentalis]